MSNESHILKHSSYYDADQFVQLTNGCRHHFSILSLNIESIKLMGHFTSNEMMAHALCLRILFNFLVCCLPNKNSCGFDGISTIVMKSIKHVILNHLLY